MTATNTAILGDNELRDADAAVAASSERTSYPAENLAHGHLGQKWASRTLVTFLEDLGLVAYYPCGDAGEELRDASGNGRHLKIQGGVPSLTTGPFGANTAWDLDGAADYATSVLTSGTGTGDSTATRLVDPTMDFALLGVVVGDICVNTTDAENNVITSISTTTRSNDTLNFAVATTMAGKAYEVHRSGFNITSAITLGCWIKGDDANNHGILGKYISTGNQRSFFVYSNLGKTRTRISTTGADNINADGDTAFGTTDYRFVIGTYDGATVKAYLDAVLEASTAQAGSIADKIAPFLVGDVDGASFWLGNLSHVFVCSQALTQAQISYVYEMGRRAIANGNAPYEGVDAEWDAPRTVTALGFAGDTIPATAALEARLKIGQKFDHYNLNRRLGADAYGKEGAFTAGFEASRTCQPGSVDIGKSIQITNLDDLQYGVGDQIDGHIYSNFDPYHGTLELWFTPFWDGDDGLDHGIFGVFGNANNRLHLYKNVSNTLEFRHRFGSVERIAQVGASSWTAGTTYFIVATWNTRTVDGTNYAKVSWDVTTTGVNANALGAPAAVGSILRLGQVAFSATNIVFDADGILGAYRIRNYSTAWHHLFDDWADLVGEGARASGHPGYPTWTRKAGAVSASTGALVLTESGGVVSRISTPSTAFADEIWKFSFTLDGIANTEDVRFWLLNEDDYTGATCDGYAVLFDAAGNFRLYDLINGAITNIVINADASWTADTNTHTIRLERLTGGHWKLYLDEALAGSGTNNTYTAISHVGFRADADANKDVVTIDDLRAARIEDWPQVQERQTVEDSYNFDGAQHDGVAPVVDEDVCFALKAACGEGGVTGALSFDHTDWHTSNNPNGNLIEDGNQEDNDAAGWGLTGTPATATPEATLVHNDLYSVLLKFLAQNDTAFVEQGINTVNDGSSFHGRFWYRGDSDNDLDEIKVKVYINGGATYVDETLLAAEHAEDVWRYVEFNIYIGEADGQTIRVEFYQNTANGADTRIYIDQLECWINKLRGDMDGTYVAGVAPGWSVSGATCTEEVTIVREGSAQKVTSTGAGQDIHITNYISLIPGAWYTYTLWIYKISGSATTIGTNLYDGITSQLRYDPIQQGAWVKIQRTVKQATTAGKFFIYSQSSDSVFIVDNVSLTQLDEVDASTETPSAVDDSWVDGEANLGDALFVDGRDGSGDYLEIPAADLPFDTNDAITIHFRIKPMFTDADPDDQLLVWDTNGVIRLMFNAATTEFDLYPDYTKCPTCKASTSGLSVAFDVGGWLTIRFDRTSAVLTGTDTVELDIAGSLEATATIAYTSQTIGALRFAGNIEIDEIRVVDGVMSDADVATLHAASDEMSDFDDPDNGVLDLTVEAITDSTYDPFIQYLSASRNVAAIRLVIADNTVVPNNGDGGTEVELGHLFVGQYFEFGDMPAFAVSDGDLDPSIVMETVGQQLVTTDKKAIRVLRMGVLPMTNAKKEAFADLRRIIGVRRDFILDIDPSGLVLSADERMLYGRFAELGPFLHVAPSKWVTDMLFRQSVE